MDAQAAGGVDAPDAESFGCIDWAAPWFAPFAERGARWQCSALDGPEPFLATLDADACASTCVTGRGLPLRFVTQTQLPVDTAYEAHIAATGRVPTRHNLHDFFNALVWLAFPRLKAGLNARQAQAIERDGVGAVRGAERDALTLFDENAALFVTTDDALTEALVAFDWRRLFVAGRSSWGTRCEVHIVGHALLEKLISPYKACTAHAWIVGAPQAYFGWPEADRRAWLDETTACALAQAAPTSRAFAPLPVLGIPGWCAANADATFYDDTGVFRPGRRAAA
ncbi:DUF3025 domain-containing protein [Trinickia fusca]|uniref:DUF3025 domain-containing protein n=1 Tax=Trinickia fusca TaxID=2419777 RepID=A0A494XMW2_9BURK|nr:DUF3025 domain-containing protein [Trinickia fusca]RKP51102.1 DUF3025 domain-containing protein [Trinickia fusca]